MAFQRVGMREQYLSHDVRQQMLALAEQQQIKPQMSRGRFIGTIFSLMIGLFLVYCSFFYVSAFYDVNKVIGASTDEGKLPTISTVTEDKNVLSAYTDFFKIRRGYMRTGQALEVKYAIPPGTKMTVRIEKCHSPVIVEVFYCQSRVGQDVTINTIRGARSFVLKDAGFYYFDESVTTMDGTETNMPFTVVWKRTNQKTPPDGGA